MDSGRVEKVDEINLLRRIYRTLTLAYAANQAGGDNPETTVHLALLEVLAKDYEVRYGTDDGESEVVDPVVYLSEENRKLRLALEDRKRAFRNLQMRKSKAHKEVRRKYEALVGAVLAHAREGRDNTLASWARIALGEDCK